MSVELTVYRESDGPYEVTIDVATRIIGGATLALNTAAGSHIISTPSYQGLKINSDRSALSPMNLPDRFRSGTGLRLALTGRDSVGVAQRTLAAIESWDGGALAVVSSKQTDAIPSTVAAIWAIASGLGVQHPSNNYADCVLNPNTQIDSPFELGKFCVRCLSALRSLASND